MVARSRDESDSPDERPPKKLDRGQSDKRKDPPPPATEKEDGERKTLKQHGLDFNKLDTTKLSKGTLFASDPKKERGLIAVLLRHSTRSKIIYLKHLVEDEVVNKFGTQTTPEEFLKEYDLVLSATTNLTLKRGRLATSRLEAATVLIQDNIEENKRAPTEEEIDDSGPVVEDVTEPMDTSLVATSQEVQEKKENDEEKVIDQDEEEVESQETNEEITQIKSAGSTAPPSGPVPERKPITMIDLLDMQIDAVLAKAKVEEDVTKASALYDKVAELLERQDAIKENNLPPVLKEIEKKERKKEEEEMKIINKTMNDMKSQVVENNKSASARLSGEKAGVAASSQPSSHTSDHVMEGVVTDETHLEAVDPEKEDVLMPDLDRNNGDTNAATEAGLLLSTGAGDDIEEVHNQHNSIGTSANAQEVPFGKDNEEMKNTKELDSRLKQQQKIDRAQAKVDAAQAKLSAKDTVMKDVPEIKERAKEQTRLDKVMAKQEKADKFAKEQFEQQMDDSMTDEEIVAGLETLKKQWRSMTEEQMKERAAQLDLEDVFETPGVEGVMDTLTQKGFLDDDKLSPIDRAKKIAAQLRQENKVKDVQTASVKTPEDLIADQVRQTAEEKGLGLPSKLGSSGIGSPVFAPASDRASLQLMMNGIGTITGKEKEKIISRLTPLWNEYKLGKMHAGVKEMERMPTRVITAPKSSVQQASRIREDETQQEKAFGNFMFWLLHTKLNGTEVNTWRGLLMYSAAMGYSDLTQVQIDWIITGNKNGDLTPDTDFFSILDEDTGLEGALDTPVVEIGGIEMTPRMAKNLYAQVQGSIEPKEPYPSKNTSPSAAPIDNSIHPDGSTGPQRANRSEFRGIPTMISNIPDPRFSMSGGKKVENIRIATIKNPKFDPTLDPNDPNYEKEYITKSVDDVGAGSKDIGARIDAAESDRLLRSLPTKLYAPIHAQACDRYLGSINYQRLSLSIEKYMKSYSQHPWGPTDVQQMYDWNVYTMALYGEMLYAFVTDIQMVRTTPVFDLGTPTAVADEYMELNELISELARFQQAAEDRAGRLGDDTNRVRPIEDHIDRFIQEQSDKDKGLISDSNIAIYSPDTPFPSSNAPPPPPPPPPAVPVAPIPPRDPPPPPGPPGDATAPPVVNGSVDTRAPIIKTGESVRSTIRSDMNWGVSRSGSPSTSTSSLLPPTNAQLEDRRRRNKMLMGL